jgi:hypothetical protein
METSDSIFFDATEFHNPKNIGKTNTLLLVLYFLKKQTKKLTSLVFVYFKLIS